MTKKEIKKLMKKQYAVVYVNNEGEMITKLFTNEDCAEWCVEYAEKDGFTVIGVFAR